MQLSGGINWEEGVPPLVTLGVDYSAGSLLTAQAALATAAGRRGCCAQSGAGNPEIVLTRLSVTASIF